MTIPHTTSGTNRALIVCVGNANSSVQSTGVTYAGVAMTLVNRRSVNYGGPQHTLEMWALSNPASGTNNVVISKSSSAADTWTGIVSFTGANQSTASLTGTVVGNNDNPSLTVSSAADEIAIDCMFGDFLSAQPTPPVPGAGQTRQVDVTNGGSFPIWMVMSTETGAASVTMDWTTDGTDNMHIAFGVKPTAAAQVNMFGRRRF